ncbi:MAG TPA: hypothetical protein VGL25_16055 [Casimicrobiaceae bacterium]|jgi:hypothetical protein
MSLAGKGAVAIWNDTTAEGRSQFFAWHGSEHMPERAGIAGFLRGRRYVALEGTPEFFTLYETVSPRTVTGPDYLARLNDPTPWTTATIPYVRNVARALCEVCASFGEGQGGLIATFRYAVDGAHADDHRKRMTQVELPVLADARGVAGCHLLIADEAASAVETAERKVRNEKIEIPRWIVLVESWDDVNAFTELCHELLSDEAFEDAAAIPELGIYRLQNSRSQFPWGAG